MGGSDEVSWMIGADRWIAKSGYCRFTPAWWRDVLWVIPRRVLRHKWQRMTTGFSRFDVYNGDNFIADVIAATADGLFNNSHGHPPTMPHEEWLDILLAIRDGFSADDDDTDRTPADSAWELLQQHFKDFWD
jgi:hypothetical protein